MAYRNHRNAASAPSIYQTVADRIILLPVWQSSSGCKRRCIEGMSTPSCRKPSTVLRQIGELDAVVGEHGMDLVGHVFDQRLQEAQAAAAAVALAPMTEIDWSRLKASEIKALAARNAQSSPPTPSLHVRNGLCGSQSTD